MLGTATLEQVVFDLQTKVNKPSSDNWLENLIDSISDDVQLFLKL